MISGVLKRPEVVHSLSYRCQTLFVRGKYGGGGATAQVKHVMSATRYLN